MMIMQHQRKNDFKTITANTQCSIKMHVPLEQLIQSECS